MTFKRKKHSKLKGQKKILDCRQHMILKKLVLKMEWIFEMHNTIIVVKNLVGKPVQAYLI